MKIEFRLTTAAVIAAILISPIVARAGSRSHPLSEDAALDLLERTLKRDRVYEKRISLDESLVVAEDQHPDLVSLDDALTSLASVDERKSRVVELRFFGGLSVEETAEILKVSPDTVMRDWRLSKLWLLREMSKRSDAT